MVVREIKRIVNYYENFLVEFKGDKNQYFMKPEKLIGLKIKGNVVKKKTRTWFE